MLGEALVDVLGPIESVRYPLEIDCCDFPYRSNTIGYFVINSKINQFDQQKKKKKKKKIKSLKM
jgi:hypothetical protein